MWIAGFKCIDDARHPCGLARDVNCDSTRSVHWWCGGHIRRDRDDLCGRGGRRAIDGAAGANEGQTDDKKRLEVHGVLSLVIFNGDARAALARSMAMPPRMSDYAQQRTRRHGRKDMRELSNRAPSRSRTRFDDRNGWLSVRSRRKDAADDRGQSRVASEGCALCKSVPGILWARTPPVPKSPRLGATRRRYSTDKTDSPEGTHDCRSRLRLRRASNRLRHSQRGRQGRR